MIHMQMINPVQCLKDVITDIGASRPMVVRKEISNHKGRCVISLAIEEGGMRDPEPGDRVVIHIDSRPAL